MVFICIFGICMFISIIISIILGAADIGKNSPELGLSYEDFTEGEENDI